MGRMADRVALITGGASGMGATAVALALINGVALPVDGGVTAG